MPRSIGYSKGLKKHARAIGLAVLLGVTAFGLYRFFSEDWRQALSAWRHRGLLLAAAGMLSLLDLLLDGVVWTWVYKRFRTHVLDAAGVGIYLSALAGLLVPAQLGRTIRVDALVRLGRASAAQSIKAEVVVLFLDAAALATLFAGLAASMAHWLAGPLVGLCTAAVLLLLGDRVSAALSRTRVAIPARFWRKWQTAAGLLVRLVGWAAHGLALYVLTLGLADHVGPFRSVLWASAATLAGSGSGLPGGIGISEGVLGVTLGVEEIPAASLVILIAAYRLVTFWAVLPIGWLAMILVSRRRPAQGQGSAGA